MGTTPAICTHGSVDIRHNLFVIGVCVRACVRVDIRHNLLVVGVCVCVCVCMLAYRYDVNLSGVWTTAGEPVVHAYHLV